MKRCGQKRKSLLLHVTRIFDRVNAWTSGKQFLCSNTWQEVLDFAAKQQIKPQVEILPLSQVSQAFQRLEKNDVKYRFVLEHPQQWCFNKLDSLHHRYFVLASCVSMRLLSKAWFVKWRSKERGHIWWQVHQFVGGPIYFSGRVQIKWPEKLDTEKFLL